MQTPILTNVLWLLLVALGLNLVRIGARARSLPEALLGFALLSSGPGVSLLQYGIAHLHPGALRLGVVLVSIGGCFISAFAVTVFRPGVGWARALLALFVLGYAAGMWHQLGVIDQVGLVDRGTARPSLVFLGARFVGFAWCAFEAARYRGMYVKRLALGLADAVIANRFLLYAIWTAALATLPAVMGLSIVLDAGGDSWRSGLHIGARAVGAVALVTMWLIFMPPRAYLRFIEARHARKAAAEAGA
jgi:hypothetical protein